MCDTFTDWDQHVTEVTTKEDSDHASLLTVQVSSNREKITPESFRETTLAGNVWLDQLERLSFNKNSNKIPQQRTWEDSQDWQITLRPMDIRSFIVKYL